MRRAMSTKKLPDEIVSLLQYVELNEAGWWDKAIQRLVLGVVWHSDKRLDSPGVMHELQKLLGISINLTRVSKQIEILKANNELIEVSGRLKLPENKITEYTHELVRVQDNQIAAQQVFVEAITEALPTLAKDSAEKIWEVFNRDLLAPMIRDLGVRAYELIAGTRKASDIPNLAEFLNQFPSEMQSLLRRSVIKFLDPKNAESRSYIMRLLNAYFFTEASQLKDKTLQKIIQVVEGKPVFNILFDTNFLFSIFSLHDNPSNEAAVSLINLINETKEYVTVNSYVSPLTIDEAKVVLQSTKRSLESITFTPDVTSAIAESEGCGMIKRYAQERLKYDILPEDYFAPYLFQLIELLQTKGIQLIEEDLDLLRKNPVIRDEIEQQLEFLQKTHGQDAKSFYSVEHDVVLWNFVKQKRPARIDSPISAKYWVITVDYGFLQYDAYRRRLNSSILPICLHPTSLIQMLQFWIPRTTTFEETIINNLRLPFLFQAFGEGDESVTVKLLQTLSYFENISDLSEHTITNMLINKNLRKKIGDSDDANDQIEAIKDFLQIEEAKLRVDLETSNQTIQNEQKANQELAARLEAHVTKQSELEIKNKELELSIANLENQKAQEDSIRSFVTRWVLLPLLIIILASVGLSYVFDFGISKIYQSIIIFTCMALGEVALINSVGLANIYVSDWKPFNQFHKFYKRILALIGTVILGIVATAIYEYYIKPLLFSSP